MCTNKLSISMKSIPVSIFTFIPTFRSGIIMPTEQNSRDQAAQENCLFILIRTRCAVFKNGRGQAVIPRHGSLNAFDSIKTSFECGCGTHIQTFAVASGIKWLVMFCPIEARNIAVNSLNQALMKNNNSSWKTYWKSRVYHLGNIHAKF